MHERRRHPGLGSTARRNSSSVACGRASGNRHARGLCAKTWTASQPISSARSSALHRRPSTWAPRSTRSRHYSRVTVRVRMAPSPTGLPAHRRSAHVPLQLAVRARRGGECLLRIENTDTSREVAESVEQIQRSLRWLGIDWDGPVTFQLDAMARAGELADQLVAEGKAYEDEGAIRFRMPDEGVTGWDDAVRGWIEFPNEKLEDRRPRPLRRPADLQLRLARRGHGRRHHPRDPRQRPRLEHAEADPDPARARPRAARLRARAGRARRRREEALEAPRRPVGRRVPRGRATSPRRS